MKTNPGTARVMVATDNKDDANQILRQLKSQFEHVSPSTDPDRVVEDFELFKPDVLVLAFDSLDKAQRYYLGLYRLGHTVHQHPHRTVMLCNKEEVQAVFDLCKKEYFDDYVLYWPHTHDGPRLAMSIWIACREMMALHSTLPDAGALRVHARQLGELESLLENHLADGVQQIEVARSTLLDAQMPGSQDFAIAIDSLGTWASGLKNSIAPALAGTRALTDAVRKIRPIVLVVDDDELARQLIGRTLDRKVYDVLFAGDGVEALSQLRRFKPDVILMDVRMPGMDGVALTQRLKTLPHLMSTPIIMMTGQARRETLVSSIEAGAAAFVVKPFTREALMAKLQKVLML